MDKKDIEFLTESYLLEMPFNSKKIKSMPRKGILDAIDSLYSAVKAIKTLHMSRVEMDMEDEYVGILNNTLIIRNLEEVTKELEDAFRRLTNEG